LIATRAAPNPGPRGRIGMFTMQPESRARRRAKRAQAKVTLGFLVVALLVGFALENSQRVPVDYLYATRESRLIYVIFGAALVGALADRLFTRRG